MLLLHKHWVLYDIFACTGIAKTIHFVVFFFFIKNVNFSSPDFKKREQTCMIRFFVPNLIICIMYDDELTQCMRTIYALLYVNICSRKITWTESSYAFVSEHKHTKSTILLLLLCLFLFVFTASCAVLFLPIISYKFHILLIHHPRNKIMMADVWDWLVGGYVRNQIYYIINKWYNNKNKNNNKQVIDLCNIIQVRIEVGRHQCSLRSFQIHQSKQWIIMGRWMSWRQLDF